MSNSVTNISAMSLFVDDLQEAKKFYQDVFGVEVAFEDSSAVVVKFDHLLINLLSSDKGADLVGEGNVGDRRAGQRFQLSIWVDDVDAVHAELVRKGVDILSGPQNQPWGMRTVTFNDPAGHSWEIAAGIGGS
jgi:catechol 2,3-dioxygenase-like lactoylglutathione lyase family enzyme